jgi:hypothetical protein
MHLEHHTIVSTHEHQTVEGLPQQTAKASWIFTPVFATVLRDQRILRLITAIALLHLLAGLTGMPGWKCPVYATFAVPCPGCGLSRAMVLLVRGELQAAFAAHIFAPIFLTGILAMVSLSLLPVRFCRSAVRKLAILERYTGLAGFLVIGMTVYWGVRFIGLIGSSMTP